MSTTTLPIAYISKLRKMSGKCWVERWVRDSKGKPKTILTKAACIGGRVMLEDGTVLLVKDLEGKYNKVFGIRVWKEHPTEDERKKLAWSYPDTLCWKCGNACTNGCSWAESGTPVNGWDAIENFAHKGSYTVLDCPKFCKENRREALKGLDADAGLELIGAIVRTAREDYIRYPRLRGKIAQFFISPKGYFQYLVHMDGEPILRAVKKEAAEHDEERRKEQEKHDRKRVQQSSGSEA